MIFSRIKPNINPPSELMMMANKYGFLVPRLKGGALTHTWIHHIIVVNKYLLVSRLIFLSI